MSAFVHGEELLAEALGLPDRLLKTFRQKKLVEGVDFGLNGGRLAYSSAGAGKVAAGLLKKNGDELEAELPAWLEQSRLRAPGELPTFTGTVSRFYRNPHLVELTLPDQRTCQVRVQKTVNLREGMRLKVAEIAEGCFELAQRLPRSVREGRKAVA